MVMKFIASRPHIVPLLLSISGISTSESSGDFLGRLNSRPMAYLATSPPIECATKEIFRSFGFPLITSITWLHHLNRNK
jgi:hypothetical protein